MDPFTVKKLLNELKKYDKKGYGDCEIKMFAHDHDMHCHDEGVGYLYGIEYHVNDAEEEFIAFGS